MEDVFWWYIVGGALFFICVQFMFIRDEIRNIHHKVKELEKSYDRIFQSLVEYD
jgi:hypothetical protein